MRFSSALNLVFAPIRSVETVVISPKVRQDGKKPSQYQKACPMDYFTVELPNDSLQNTMENLTDNTVKENGAVFVPDPDKIMISDLFKIDLLLITKSERNYLLEKNISL